MSKLARNGAVWPFRKKASIPRPSLIADRISVTFPFHGGVVKEDDAETQPRMVWDEKGRLRGVRALEDISFSLDRGARMAIIGANGSGKTTLLQVLSGILAPETGSLTTCGRITNLININLGTHPEATGHRNITLRGLAAGYSRKAIEAKRQEIVEFSELGEFLNMPMETYSAGMRMRLTFSIATAFEPEILILDEWLSAGDTAFKQKATQRMGEFVEKAGILILASHSRQLIMDNCDTCLWLNEGRVRMLGPVDEVFAGYDEEQRQKIRMQQGEAETKQQEMKLRVATSSGG